MKKLLDRWSSTEIAFWQRVKGSDYDSSEWCRYEDVAQLEAQYAELLAAAEDVSKLFEYFVVTNEHVELTFDRLCAAIAKAKGKQP